MKGGKERSTFWLTVYTTIARDKTSDAQKERRFRNFSRRNGRIVKLLLSFSIYYNFNKNKIKCYRDVSIPAAARAMNLVRRHFSISMESETFKNAASIEGKSTARNLRRKAKANHLRTKRRKMLFADIPEGERPVLLQLSGGSNFVILKEKGKDDECLVQFPDSREAVVDGERLDEVYDGICVFLQPRSSRNNSDLSGLTFPLAGKVFVAGG
jgi:hypothetical protein